MLNMVVFVSLLLHYSLIRKVNYGKIFGVCIRGNVLLVVFGHYESYIVSLVSYLVKYFVM
jgi:hypothetical protein